MPATLNNLSRHFYPLSKFERIKGSNGGADVLMVEAIATSEALDGHGTILDYEAMKEAANGYKGRIWEMHTPWAAGRAVDVTPNDEQKNISIRFKVVDPTAIAKVEEGVYTGVSVGASIKGKTGNRLFVKDWVETSLVDDASNPDSNGLNILRAAGMPERSDAMKIKDWLTRMGNLKNQSAEFLKLFSDAANDAGEVEASPEVAEKLTRIAEGAEKLVPPAPAAKVEPAPAVEPPATRAAPAVPPAAAPALEDEIKRFSGVLEAALAPLTTSLKGMTERIAGLEDKLAKIPAGPTTTNLTGSITRGADPLGLSEDNMKQARAQVQAQESKDAMAINRMVQAHTWSPELARFKTVKDWEDAVAGK